MRGGGSKYEKYSDNHLWNMILKLPAYRFLFSSEKGSSSRPAAIVYFLNADVMTEINGYQNY